MTALCGACFPADRTPTRFTHQECDRCGLIVPCAEVAPVGPVALPRSVPQSSGVTRVKWWRGWVR